MASKNKTIAKVGCPPHYWIIEQAILPTSKGICKKCDAERMFKNEFSPAYWRNYPDKEIEDAPGTGRFK